MKKIKYELESSSWDQKEYMAIENVIKSNKFSMGPYVSKYENNFAKFFGSKYSVMVNSGSSANLLMIAALFYTKKPKLKKGDEIIVPSVSWSTTYSPLQQFGLKVKFVDINRETLNIDLDALKSAITKKTKAILLVNLLGNPNNYKQIKNIIKNKNIFILEDNCESMGAKYENINAGTYGLMGTFSSFFSHHISTMEGGSIVTNNKELYHIMLSLRAHGWTRNLPETNLVTGTKSKNDFNESFKFVLPGYNLRPLEMSGAIGIEQLKKLKKLIKIRRQNAQIFQELFSNHDYINIQKETGISSWFGFSLVLKENAPFSRSMLIENLKKNNIECRPIVTGNFLKNKKLLSYFDYEIHGKHSNAEYIDKNGLFVGNHHYDLSNELNHLNKVIKNIKG